MWQKISPVKTSSSFWESVDALKDDICHANAIGWTTDARILSTNLGILHILVHKVCMDGLSRLSSHPRKATPREFYAVIYPSLKQLDDDFTRIRDNNRSLCTEVLTRGRPRDGVAEVERDEECGICMEGRKNTVLPGCGHSMCINCFDHWSMRSASCPFCRGSLEGSESSDLWILTNEDEVIDMVSLALENLRSFYLYIESFPTVVPASHIRLLDYMI